MHVMPFWSYLAAAGTITITNHLTGASARFPSDVIDTIERLCGMNGAADVDDHTTITRLRQLRVLFDDADGATTWLDAHERSALRAAPIIDQIELTNRCPYSCKMCPRTSSMTRSLGDMDIGLFRCIVEQLEGRQRYVALHHFGESLLHRDLPDIIRAAADRSVATGLSCNPPSLKPALAARLLDAGIASLVLSFDSLDAGTYRKIRGAAASLERAIRHIDALVQLRDDGRYATSITVQLIRMHDNAAETEQFLQFCRDHGVDRGVVVRFGRWDFSDQKTASLGEFTTPLYKGFCLRPQQSVVVLWDGRVVACCHDYDGLVCLGDLNDYSLDEIWAGRAAAEFRRKSHATSLCRSCAFGRHFREQKQRQLGLHRFHKDVETGVGVLEYVSPTAAGRTNLQFFDGFDLSTSSLGQAIP